MKVGSLFSGIGGLDLGLERAGMKVIWQVENDLFCQKVLKKHWPEVPCYGDIKEIDFTQLEHPDLLCGGFPCQPVSDAGKRQGDQDERWLWPEYYRAICEAKPKWVLVENVPGLLSFEGGRLFSGILRDLATSGYDVEWDMLSAAAFGAPHLRFRVFLVAWNPESYTSDKVRGVWKGKNSKPGNDSPMANPNSRRCPQRNPQKRAVQISDSYNHIPDSRLWGLPKWNRVFTRGEYPHSPIETSEWWAVEPDVGRVADGISSRVDRLKCLGNAVVPQIVEWIGKRIMEVEND